MSGTFAARFTTRCPDCDALVEPGDQMGWVDKVAVCIDCLADRPTATADLGPRCPNCFTYHRGECA